ncbi:hypothetical protein [Salinicoccus sp. Marseille-QA3877]
MEFEKLAVDKIANLCALSTRLSSDIPVNDKGISFDGKIILYNKKGRKIEGYEYEIPIQVKSKQVTAFTEGSISYSFKSAHFKNYIKRGGCLVFIVEINKLTGEAKPYFKCFLPMYLNELLISKRENKYISQNFHILESKAHLIQICEFMKNEMIKQHNKGLISLSNPTIKKVEIVPNTPNLKDIFKENSIFKEPFSTYGHIDQMELPVGISYLEGISIINTLSKLYVNDEEFNLNITYTKKENEWHLFIEDKFLLKPIDGNSQKVRFSLIKYGDVNAQLPIINFIIILLKNGHLKSRYFEIIFDTDNILDSIEYFQEMKYELENFKKTAAKLFLPLNFVIQGDEDIHTLSVLNDMVLEKNFSKTKFENNSDYIFFIIKLYYKKFLLFYNPKSKDIINPFESFEERSIAYFTHEGKDIVTSIFLVLEFEAFECQNFDSGIIKDSFNKIDVTHIDYQFTNINRFILNSLNAFDQFNNDSFIYLVKSLYEIASGNLIDEENKDILFLNYLQAIKRSGGNIIDGKYLKRLFEMIEIYENNNEFLFSIHVLLENKAYAIDNFSKLEEKKKQEYYNYPIYHLFKSII